MKNYWYGQQGSVVLTFSISFLFCFGFQFISLILLSKQLNSSTEDCLKQFKLQSEKQNSRIEQIELQNHHQDDEMKSLKREMSKYSIKMEKINSDNSAGTLTNNWHQEPQKRAARLIPVSLLINKQREEEINTSIPPASCDDLNKFGYTLNGIYFVMKNNVYPSQIDAVFCDFKSKPNGAQKSTSSLASDNRLGSLNLKEKSEVYFYVQRIGKMPTVKDDVIRFNKERLNIGGAMDLSSGVFTAPKAGIYFFSFSIAKEGFNVAAIHVYLRKNTGKIGVSIVGGFGVGLSTMPATIQATLKLEEGDKIDLLKANSGAVDSSSNEPTGHFTGWLLKEEEEGVL